MTILAWLIVIPLFLALFAQIAFLVVGLVGLGSTLFTRFQELRAKPNVPAPRV